MLIASRSKRSSISARICSVQGSAPWMPTLSEQRRESSPWRSNSSPIASMYDGVTMITAGSKSWISWTWRSVWPPDIGITVQPSRSPP